MRIGKCKFYHDPCNFGKNCQNIRQQNCKNFHPIEEIYCPRGQTCEINICPYKHPCKHITGVTSFCMTH